MVNTNKFLEKEPILKLIFTIVFATIFLFLIGYMIGKAFYFFSN